MSLAVQQLPVTKTSGGSKSVRLSELFAGVKSDLETKILEASNPAVPKASPVYRFDPDHTGQVVRFINASNGDGLMIIGPTGSGKSSLVTEIAARLNRPVQQITCSGSMEIADLIGGFRLVKDETVGVITRFVHGCLPKAMNQGHILLLDEYDYAPPSAIAALNGVIQGSPLVIEALGGQIVEPHPDFRVIITGNTGGGGDHRGGYVGTRQHNVAFLDRFRVIEIDYMTPADEEDLLRQLYPSLAAIIPSAVKLANAVRDSNKKGDLASTFSFRTLSRWMNLLEARGSLKKALDAAILLRLDPSDQHAIGEMALGIFGGQSWSV